MHVFNEIVVVVQTLMLLKVEAMGWLVLVVAALGLEVVALLQK